jgi:hypothetical protein
MPVNVTLCRALANAALDDRDVAKQIGVVPKTVRRWKAGRVPYPRHRTQLAQLVNVDEATLWPDAAPAVLPPIGVTPPLIKAIYPHRWAVPQTAWRRLFESAQQEIGILVYSGLFLAEDNGIMRILANKARDGVTVRILLGDPDDPRIAKRGAEEGVNEAMAAKTRNALVLYQPLRALDGVDIRLHRTTLYASIYRADNELLINTHAYGAAAAHAPVLHLTKTEDDDMASTYLNSLERVWSDAPPLP